MFFRTYKSLLDIQKKALERGQETGMKIKLVLFYFCVCLIFCEILAATKAKKALKVRLLLELHKATKKRAFSSSCNSYYFWGIIWHIIKHKIKIFVAAMSKKERLCWGAKVNEKLSQGQQVHFSVSKTPVPKVYGKYRDVAARGELANFSYLCRNQNIFKLYWSAILTHRSY